MTILYEVGDALYVNMTNKCPCACTFCLRQDGDGAYGSDSLWLEHDPSVEEVISAFEKTDVEKYSEIVFCGYGEPLERLDDLVTVCKYLRRRTALKLRVNTNGLGNLIHGESIAYKLEGFIDTVSISLNAPTADAYVAVTRPKFGIQSFEALITFAKEVKMYVPNVVFTVVDTIPAEQIEASRQIAEEVGVNFRIRPLV